MSETEKTQLPDIRVELKVFDQVYDPKTEDNTKLEPVKMEEPLIVKVKTPDDLKSIISTYKMAGQIVKYKFLDDPTKVSKPKKQDVEKTEVVQAAQEIVTNNVTPSVVHAITKAIPEKKPIKYYKIGDVEIKDDNGKLYQKQWMRLTEVEAANIRVVNDKNNSIFNMSGKHLELKKWVLVENTGADESETIEDNLK